MRIFRVALALVFVLVLAGCATAPQVPVAINDTYWETPNQRIGVFVQPIEAPQFYTEGDVRLLDFAVISLAMASVKEHFAALDISDYGLLREDLDARFSQAGKRVKLISDEIKFEDLPSFSDPNSKDAVYFSAKDYSTLKDKLDVDQLLVIKPKRVGLARPYAGFVPMGAPRAICEVDGKLVDLSNNRILWYSTISSENFSTGEWDEPPTYPGLTNAFYATLESVKQQVMTHFQRGRQQQAKAGTE